MTRRRRKDGIYYRGGHYCFRYKDATDKWREKSTGVADREKAVCFKREFEELVRNHELPDQELARLPVAAAAEHWLKGRQPHISANTLRSYRSSLTSVKMYFGDSRLKSITAQNLRNYQAQRASAGISNRTINHELLALGMILKRAKLWRPIGSDYRTLRVSGKTNRRPLKEHELNTLVRTAQSKREWETLYHLMLLAAYTGCRPCEIARLQIGAIHLNGDCPHLVIKHSKTAAGLRDVPLSRIALFAMRKLLTRAEQLGSVLPEHYLLPRELAKSTKPTDAMYHRRFEGFDPVNYQRGWSRSWRSLRKAAGLQWAEFYCLRHTFITAAAESDVPLSVTKAMVGHVSTEMTEYYTQTRDKAQARAAERIGESNEQLLELVGLGAPKQVGTVH